MQGQHWLLLKSEGHPHTGCLSVDTDWSKSCFLVGRLVAGWSCINVQGKHQERFFFCSNEAVWVWPQPRLQANGSVNKLGIPVKQVHDTDSMAWLGIHLLIKLYGFITPPLVGPHGSGLLMGGKLTQQESARQTREIGLCSIFKPASFSFWLCILWETGWGLISVLSPPGNGTLWLQRYCSGGKVVLWFPPTHWIWWRACRVSADGVNGHL